MIHRQRGSILEGSYDGQRRDSIKAWKATFISHRIGWAVEGIVILGVIIVGIKYLAGIPKVIESGVIIENLLTVRILKAVIWYV